MRYVKVPVELAIPFLFMLAIIAFTVRVQFGDCLTDPGTGHLFGACVQP